MIEDDPLHPLLSRSDRELLEIRIPGRLRHHPSTRIAMWLLPIAAPAAALAAVAGLWLAGLAGWDLVDPQALALFCLMFGGPVAAVAFLLISIGHYHQRLRITSYALEVSRPFALPAVVPLADIRRVVPTREQGLRLECRTGPRWIALPGLSPPQLRSLADRLQPQSERAVDDTSPRTPQRGLHGEKRGDPLYSVMIRTDHEGFEIRIPSPLAQRLSTVTVGFGLAVLAPATALLLALPGAAIVEWSGLWLVNEVVLVRRWMLFGTPTVLALFALWSAVQSPAHQLRLTARALTVRRSGIPTESIRLADIERVGAGTGGLWAHTHDGLARFVELPGLTPPQLSSLASHVSLRLDRARRMQGSAEAVPEALERLRGGRSPDTLRE